MGSSGGSSNGSLRRRRENGWAPVFSFEPGSRLISHDSTSALVIVRPTTITTGPMPELPREPPSTLAISMDSTGSPYRDGEVWTWSRMSGRP